MVVPVRQHLLAPACPQAQIHRRRIIRPCRADSQLLLLQLVAIRQQIFAIFHGVCQAIVHTALKGQISKIICQHQGLATISANQVPEGAQVVVIGILPLDQFLLCVGQLHLGTQHINLRLAACPVKLLHIGQMLLVLVYRILINSNLLLCLQCIIICLDYCQPRSFPFPFRFQPGNIHAQLPGSDAVLVSAAGIKRQGY